MRTPQERCFGGKSNLQNVSFLYGPRRRPKSIVASKEKARACHFTLSSASKVSSWLGVWWDSAGPMARFGTANFKIPTTTPQHHDTVQRNWLDNSIVGGVAGIAFGREGVFRGAALLLVIFSAAL